MIWIEIAGWSGMVVLLLAYYLNSTGRIEKYPAAYQWMNLWGAIGIVINTYFKQAWAPMVLDIIWAGIALYALLQIRKISDDAVATPHS